MAKPRIFVSSTYYDLKHIRASLEIFIESLGYESILSEKGDIAYSPDQPLDESCYREVRNADVFVLIVGGRYGSEKSGDSQTGLKDFYDRYDSITKQEYLNAISQDLPIYVLVEKGVYSDFETYLKNKENTTINYAHVDSINIFKLIEFILSQPKNNPVQHFERYSDIENWLKEQWAGLFRELINRLSREKQISSLSSQVVELAEINKTLKRYLEEVVSKISPDSSAKLIQDETDRLADVHKQKELSSNPAIKEFHELFDIPLDVIYTQMLESNTVRQFVEKIIKSQGKNKRFSLNIDEVNWEGVRVNLNDARNLIGLKPWRPYKPAKKKK